MTREQAKELLPVIQAFAEGKTIQSKAVNGTLWVDIEKDGQANFSTELLDFRIKPEAKYRPFKTQEECWNEMRKHQPFGWLYDNADGVNVHLCFVSDGGAALTGNAIQPYEKFIERFTFIDGTPFGLNVEGE